MNKYLTPTASAALSLMMTGCTMVQDAESERADSAPVKVRVESGQSLAITDSADVRGDIIPDMSGISAVGDHSATSQPIDCQNDTAVSPALSDGVAQSSVAESCKTPFRIRTSASASQTAVREEKTTAQSAESSDTQQSDSRQTALSYNTATSTPADHYIALKTNVAYDAAALLNLAVDYGFSDRFSAEIPVVWSFWDWDQRRGVRTVTLQPGVRYWFDRPGHGHALGVNADIAWYNIRWEDTRYQSDSRPLLGASINYSYTLSLGRRWNAEFLIAAGYFNTRYNTYYNIADGAKIETRQKNYFGPTRLAISLVYSL